MNYYLILTVGALAQLLFSARLLVQWIASERAKQVLSPTLFWQLSMVASFLLCFYGWLRHDFAIILGQLIAYYIYIWNLKAKNSWDGLPRVARIIFFGLPLIAISYLLIGGQATFSFLFKQKGLSTGLILFGVAGQLTFTLRFIFQWWYSRKAGESVLPPLFWVISLTGSSMIIAYAIIRRDPILLLGQLFGTVVYARNILIGLQQKGKEADTSL